MEGPPPTAARPPPPEGGGHRRSHSPPPSGGGACAAGGGGPTVPIPQQSKGTCLRSRHPRVLPLPGSPTRTSAQRARERTVEPTNSVSLDRVVRSVSVSEQSDESGTNPAIRRPPSPSMPRPRQPARDKAPAVEPCVPSPVGTGPAQGVQGDVRSEASSPPAGGVRGGRSSPRKTGGVRGTESPAVARAVSPEQTSTEDSVFCRWSAPLVRARDLPKGTCPRSRRKEPC